MGVNAEIRTLLIAQGVGLAVPPTTLDGGGEVDAADNATTSVPALTFDLADMNGVIIDWIFYRSTNLGYKYASGRTVMVGVPDGATNPDKWQLLNPLRSDGIADTGLSFTLTDTATNTSRLNLVLDAMAGTGHVGKFFYKLTNFLA
jgi:hypothetical protein